jgi:hypothetical protein
MISVTSKNIFHSLPPGLAKLENNMVLPSQWSILRLHYVFGWKYSTNPNINKHQIFSHKFLTCRGHIKLRTDPHLRI